MKISCFMFQAGKGRSLTLRLENKYNLNEKAI